MPKFSPHHKLSTIAIQAEETENPNYSHITPIYQSSTFTFPDVRTGQEIFSQGRPGYYYTRVGNPNATQLAKKYAILEGLDLIRKQPNVSPDQIVTGKLFTSGMAAISTTILSKCKPGDTLITQSALYSHTYSFLDELLPSYGVNVIWVDGSRPKSWEKAFEEHPQAVLALVETPANPTMEVVDLKHISNLAKHHNAWVMVDNTFATPYCQRPLANGADLIVHSTTKYLSGHGLIIGGALISSHIQFIQSDLQRTANLFGGSPSPFDCWLANIGLKTFDLRMAKHCENARLVAEYLMTHQKVANVYYPGLTEFPGHETASKQMFEYGGMLSFELKGGYKAGERLMNNLKIISLAVSLGNIDSLIQHPASMTHHNIPTKEREKIGIKDGLVRFSVGIEDIQDILNDLEQGLSRV